MPVIEPANTQQILQMSSAVEKVQAQQVQHLAADQYQAEILSREDEMKRAELQDPEKTAPGEPVNPDGRGRRGLLRIKKSSKNSDKEGRPETHKTGFPENPQGLNLNISI